MTTTRTAILVGSKGTEISLTYADKTVKTTTVRRLTKVISYKGKYFLRNDEIGFTHYEQVSGEELNNIEVV